MEYVYRLLRSDENVQFGLRAKDPNSSVSMVWHVAFGSRGASSKYISTSKTYSAVRNLASICWDDHIRIAKINIRKLQNQHCVQVYDLTESGVLSQHRTSSSLLDLSGFDLEYSPRAEGFAARFAEVLIVGTIPPDCVHMIYEGSKLGLPLFEP